MGEHCRPQRAEVLAEPHWQPTSVVFYPPCMDPGELKKLLAELWLQHRPEMLERLAILERFSEVLANGESRPEDQKAAIGAAHKLAGALGTFGLHEGTNVAREVEQKLSAGELNLAELQQQITRLRSLITAG